MGKLLHPMPADRKPFRVLFICMGNICRSPAAEIVFRHQVAEAGLAGAIEIVPDPYYGGQRGFEEVADLVEDACGGLLEEIRKSMP